MKNSYLKGMLAGAIAGFFNNIGATTSMYLAESIGIWEPKVAYDISLWMVRFTSHLALNIIWGTILGIIFVRFYDSIPGKGILKGIIFGLVFYYLIASFRIASYLQSYGEAWSGNLWAKSLVWTGFFSSIAYGLAIGYLYKPPK